MKDNRRNFLRLLDETWPGLRAAFVQSMSQVRSNIALRALEQAIDRGDVQAAFDALRMDEAALYALDEALAATVVAGGRYQMDSIKWATRRLPQGRRVIQSFGGRNERAERIIREIGAKLVTEVVEDTKVMLAETIRSGLEAGANPRKTALDISGRIVRGKRRGGLVGLHSREARWVQNYRDRLTAEGRAADQVESMARRYADKLLRQRGERIARTETIKALNAGRQEAIDQLVESPNNNIAAADVTKTWQDTGDSRTRASHGAADGQKVGKDEAFTVGGYQLRYPGDTSLGAPGGETINCRCYMQVRTT